MKQKGLLLDTKYYIEHQLMNPLSQLFALCLTQMPGYAGHKPGMEEVAASELLFQKALGEADTRSKHQFAKKFGMTIVPRASAGGPSTAKAATVKKQTQSQSQLQLDRFMLDSMLIAATKSRRSPTQAKEATQPKEAAQPKPKRSKKKAAAVDAPANES